MSLFGNQQKPNLFGSLNTGAANASQAQGSSLFGNTANTGQASQPAQSISPFGGVNQQQSTGGGLFGATSQPQQSGGLFGSSNQNQQSGSLFGAPNQNQQSGSLFGAASSQPQQSGGLFGAATSQPQQSGGLFGAPSQPQQQNSLFGGVAQKQQPGGLFGTASQTQQPGSLFGTASQAPRPGGLFGNTNQPQNTSLFNVGGNTQNQSAFGNTLQNASQSQAQAQPRLGTSSIWQPGEKTIPEQMQTVFEKWSTESTNCTFEHYFYNLVPSEHIPLYGPANGEDVQKWEDALSKKPSEGYIPVLCRGFAALGSRLRTQVQSVNALRHRLNEINNSLDKSLQTHDNHVSVRVIDARRRHVALSQRCLHLATKVQILRNRGYSLDSAEEELKKKLTELERAAFDPQLSGREEEIWARMVTVRERARLLQEETQKSGAALASDSNLDEDILRKTKLILQDYDSQITHLQKELDAIREDFAEWEGTAAR